MKNLLIKRSCEDFDKLKKIVTEYNPDVIIHLAAQAGVRYNKRILEVI